MTEPTKRELAKWCAKHDPEISWQNKARINDIARFYCSDRNASVRVVEAALFSPDADKHEDNLFRFGRELEEIVQYQSSATVGMALASLLPAEQLIRAAYRATEGR